jgi:hypothetical protein
MKNWGHLVGALAQLQLTGALSLAGASSGASMMPRKTIQMIGFVGSGFFAILQVSTAR